MAKRNESTEDFWAAPKVDILQLLGHARQVGGEAAAAEELSEVVPQQPQILDSSEHSKASNRVAMFGVAGLTLVVGLGIMEGSASAAPAKPENGAPVVTVAEDRIRTPENNDDRSVADQIKEKATREKVEQEKIIKENEAREREAQEREAQKETKVTPPAASFVVRRAVEPKDAAPAVESPPKQQEATPIAGDRAQSNPVNGQDAKVDDSQPTEVSTNKKSDTQGTDTVAGNNSGQTVADQIKEKAAREKAEQEKQAREKEAQETAAREKEAREREAQKETKVTPPAASFVVRRAVEPKDAAPAAPPPPEAPPAAAPNANVSVPEMVERLQKHPNIKIEGGRVSQSIDDIKDDGRTFTHDSDRDNVDEVEVAPNLLTALLDAADEGMQLKINSLTTGVHSPGSFHFVGDAVDVALDEVWYRKMFDERDKYGVNELITANPPEGTANLKNGQPFQYSRAVLNEHTTHVHSSYIPGAGHIEEPPAPPAPVESAPSPNPDNSAPPSVEGGEQAPQTIVAPSAAQFVKVRADVVTTPENSPSTPAYIVAPAKAQFVKVRHADGNTPAQSPASPSAPEVQSNHEEVVKDPEIHIYDFYIGKGLSPAQSVGMLANCQVESSCIPGRVEGPGIQIAEAPIPNRGFSLYQWTSEGRQRALVEYAESQGKSPADLQVALEYSMIELEGPYHAAYEKLLQAETPERAAEIICRFYEVPDKMETQVKLRQDFAREIMNRIGSR